MTSVVRWVEVHRLAVACREAAIAQDVGNRVGQVWLATRGTAVPDTATMETMTAYDTALE